MRKICVLLILIALICAGCIDNTDTDTPTAPTTKDLTATTQRPESTAATDPSAPSEAIVSTNGTTTEAKRVISGLPITENSVFWDQNAWKPSDVTAIYREIPDVQIQGLDKLADVIENNKIWLEVSEYFIPALQSQPNMKNDELAELLIQNGVASKIASQELGQTMYRFIGIWLPSEMDYAPFYYAYLQVIDNNKSETYILFEQSMFAPLDVLFHDYGDRVGIALVCNEFAWHNSGASGDELNIVVLALDLLNGQIVLPSQPFDIESSSEAIRFFDDGISVSLTSVNPGSHGFSYTNYQTHSWYIEDDCVFITDENQAIVAKITFSE